MHKYSTHGILFVWLLLPNFALIVETPVNTWQGTGLLIIALLLVCLPAVFTGIWRTFYLINIPVAFASGFITSYILYYHIPVTIGLVHSILDTNFRESFEVLHHHIPATLLSISGFITYLLLSLSQGRNAIIHRDKFIAATLWAIIILIYYPYLNFNLHERFNIFFNNSFINNSYPFNIARTFSRVWIDRTAKQHSSINPPVITPVNRDRKELYVLVIGESVRNETFGKELRSSNWTSRFDNLIYYDDVLSQANFTSASIEMLLTGTEPRDLPGSIPNLILWQKAAGCYSAVISNNSTYEFNRDADLKDSEGDSGVTHYTRFDHDMLPIAASLIHNSNHQKLCLVLHMVGSHADYAARYDSRFAKYPLIGDDIGKTRAAYRNTIVALLDFMDQLIRIINRDDRFTFLAFISDHGENLMEINGLKEHVTMTPTSYELMVPMLFWASQSFINANTSRWTKLRDQRHTAVSNAYLMPTFLDAMGILKQVEASHGLTPSLFTDITPRPRYYVTPDMVLHPERDMLR